MLGGTAVPNQVKIGLGILLAAVLISWKPLPSETPSISVFVFGLSIARELLIGTLAGYAAVLVFGALQVAGEMMGIGSGFAAGRILNPALGISGSALDQFFVLISMLFFLVLNGHHSLLLAIKRTFSLVPVNSPLPEFSLQMVTKMTSELIVAGVQLALPVMGALLLADLTLGLLARVAPQVQVFFLGVPMKVAIGLIAVGLTFSVMLPTLANLFHSLGLRSLQLLGG